MSKMKFSDMVQKQRNAINKAPIMQTTFFGSEEELGEMYDANAPVSIHEIDSMCPNASVVPNMGDIEIIWFLPSGNHPGIWIVERSRGYTVRVTAYPFDNPDEEGVAGFIEDIKSKAQSRGEMSPEEVYSIVREVNDRLGHMSSPRGIPIGKKRDSASKSARKSQSNVRKGYYSLDTEGGASADENYRQVLKFMREQDMWAEGSDPRITTIISNLESLLRDAENGIF